MNSVTVIIPTYNEARNIRKVVEDLLCENGLLKQVEILVIDGGSKDGTRDIVRKLEYEYQNIVRLIENPRRIQAAALNIGINQAKGEIIVRCDAHARYEQGYIRACLDAFEESRADVVGGAQIAIGETYFQKVISTAYNSFLGSGGSKYRKQDYSGLVDTVWLGAYRKEIFSDGLRFNEKVSVDEDYELFYLLRLKEKKIYLSSSIRAYYLPRETLWALMQQFFIHGKSVSLTVRYMLKRIIGRPLIMLSAIIILLIIGVAACFSYTSLCVLGAGVLMYFFVLFLQTLFCIGKKPLRQLFLVPIVLATMHLSYSIGLFLGCIRELFLWALSLANIRKWLL
ncbi:MAG: glycosyltransferase family 2 protein [Candidatus Scalindua sediminis]|nr:glycosyltransferase family 2 protein [Candidatus Scalindua sediminis]